MKELLFCTLIFLCAFSLHAADEIHPGFLIKLDEPAPEVLVEAIKAQQEEYFLPAATVVQFVDCDSMRCDESLGALEDFLWEPLKERDLWVIGIAAGSGEEEVTPLINRVELTFPVIPDPERALFGEIAEEGVPRTLILNSKGEVVYAHAGYRVGREAEIRAFTEAVLDDERLPFNPEIKLSGKPNIDEELAARDIRGKQAPDVPVEVWITEPPEQKGRYVLVDFWATWCPPCRESLRQGERLHSKFEDRLVTWAVSDEPASTVEDYVNEEGLKQPIGTDTKGRAKDDELHIVAIPHAFIADPQGVVVWQGNPLALWANEGALLEEVLSGTLEASN